MAMRQTAPGRYESDFPLERFGSFLLHASLEKGVDVLIATPGRLLDHFERGRLLLTGVELLVIDDGFDLFLTLVLFPTFAWDDQAYHLDKDPEHRAFSELLVDVVVADVIDPWGGGKWHMEIVRTVSPEPEDWNGEM